MKYHVAVTWENSVSYLISEAMVYFSWHAPDHTSFSLYCLDIITIILVLTIHWKKLCNLFLKYLMSFRAGKGQLRLPTNEGRLLYHFMPSALNF